MAIVERPPRTTTCRDCGKVEQRSPYGPAPDRCSDCQTELDHEKARRRVEARRRAAGVAPRGRYRVTRTPEARP